MDQANFELGSGQVVERLWVGMLEHARPIALIAGDAVSSWPHVTEVARQLLERTAGKEMMFPHGGEWMGVMVEIDPRRIRPRQVRDFVHTLGSESERFVVVLLAGGDVVEAERWIRVLYPPEPSRYPPIELVLQEPCPRCDAKPGERCVKDDGQTPTARQHPARVMTVEYDPPERPPVPALMVVLDEDVVERPRVMRVYRALERREPGRGRGVVLLRRRERLFSSP